MKGDELEVSCLRTCNVEPWVNDGTINILNYPWNTSFHGLAIVRTAQASLCLHVGSKIALGTAK